MPPMRHAHAAVLLLALAVGCGRPSPEAARRQRLLARIDMLPRLEAEQRAWPRGETLACDERAASRAREIDALSDELEELTASLGAKEGLRPLFEACTELKGCARCDEGAAAHCSRTRDLLLAVQLAVTRAGLHDGGSAPKPPGSGLR